MLIHRKELVEYLNIKPRGVIHVGAHLGEEREYYEEGNMVPVTWVEAHPALVKRMKSFLKEPNHIVINMLLWSESDVLLKMNVASNSQSSSILPLAEHKKFYPNVEYKSYIEMPTSTLDDLIDAGHKCEMLVLDLQGAELEVLKGLTGERWKNIKWVYTEVYKKDLYLDCAKIREVDRFLAKKGFRRIFTRWQRNHGWGDAIYSSQGVLPILPALTRLHGREIKNRAKFNLWLLRNKKFRQGH